MPVYEEHSNVRNVSPHTTHQFLTTSCTQFWLLRLYNLGFLLLIILIVFMVYVNAVMRRLTNRLLSEKCVVRRFRRCANVIEYTYTNLDSIT
jgi:hypothetical protein